jgi:N-acetylglucosaminyldiphosphoundecaprenol N-acetyl-beta-D-mannosaminyltransferase
LKVATGESNSIEFLGVAFDKSNLQAVLSRLLARRGDQPFEYVVTPNVDHLVRLHDAKTDNLEKLWRAYEAAALRSCDSRILARLAQWRNLVLPVVTGSDLTRALLEQIEPNTSVAVIGGSADLPSRLRERYPNAEIWQHRPPMGLRNDPIAMAAAADFVAGVNARFTIIAVGSPQQELLAHAIASRGGVTGVGLCVGAALDFLVGEQRRAPAALQTAGLEWLYRLASNPRRFWRRYLVEGPKIFLLWWRDRPRDIAGKSLPLPGAASSVASSGVAE